MSVGVKLSDCLLLIGKVRAKYRTYVRVSVLWKTENETEGIIRLTYTGLLGELEHLKVETRLINERFASVMGECVIWTTQVYRRYSK